MLNAVLAGKKRGTGLQSPFSQAEGAEDVLTASVFERLSYLPDKLFTAVFSELLGLPFGPLQNLEFWPFWELMKDGKDHTEPDVLLQDTQRSLLVEAKRYDYVRQQDPKQLANELESGWREEILGDNCLLLVLGGLTDYTEAGRQHLLAELLPLLPPGSETRFTLVCRSWQQLYLALEAKMSPDSPPGCLRLLDDLAKCYSWHGMRTHDLRGLNGLSAPTLGLHTDAFAAWSMK